MGLVPIANSEKLIEDTAPLHKMLGDEIGRPVEGFIATNYIGIVEALGTGTIDFALIPPFAYILANKKNGTEALLTSINKHDEPGYYSVLLVRPDSGIEKVEDLKGKKRTKSIVEPRQIAMYLARELTNSSLPKLGTEFGKDHSTVLHAYDKINEEYKLQGDITKAVNDLKKKLELKLDLE